MNFKLGELFCGAGGMTLGALNAQVKTADKAFSIRHGWATDIDFDSCATYRNNIFAAGESTVIQTDVKDLDITRLSPIDAFAYGFPCNDFSHVGETKGFDGNYGPLYSYGIRVLNHFSPRFFVAENVGGMLTANEGKAFVKILNDLESSGKHGYKLTVHKYRAEKYGIPQKRHRIFIVGICNSENIEFKVPAPTTPKKEQYKPVREALENPPITSEVSNQEGVKLRKQVLERLKHIGPGENAWTAKLPDHLKLQVKGTKLSQIYKRLHPDKPSYTITANGGGGTHGYHYDEPRALTNRERARIQTFPDDYTFSGSSVSVRKQIGMAVPPELSRIIFEAVLKSFAGLDYDHIPANMKLTEDSVTFTAVRYY